MSNNNLSRRALLRILPTLGLGIYIFGCGSDDEKNTENIDNSNADAVDKIIKILSEEDVVFIAKNDDEFNKLNTNFNLFVAKQPKCIALVKNDKGVAKAIAYAKQEQLKVSIKSGGHYFENFSTIENGLVINLSLLKTIEMDDQYQITVGSGVLLQELYDFLLPKGRLLPAGSCGTVGIGGLVLGGGYGFFSRKFGLTCDYLIDAAIIDMNGEISKASNDKDLLFALKGAGNGNFGVVTSFKFSTQISPKTFSRWRLKAYRLDKIRAKELLKIWFEITEQFSESTFSAYVLNKKTLTILITDFDKSNTDSTNLLINSYMSLFDKIDEVKTLPINEALKNYYGIEHPLFFKNSSAGYYRNFEHIEPFSEQLVEKVIQSEGLIFQMNTLGGKIKDKNFADNSIYPHREFNYLAELQCYWEKPEEKQNLVEQNIAVLNLIENNGIEAHYVNYPSLDIKNAALKYFKEAGIEKVKSLKLKYDKNNILYNQHQISRYENQ